MKAKPSKKGKVKTKPGVMETESGLKPIRIKAEVRTCDELKAVLSTRIKAHVKDARLAKELENALMDMVAYGGAGL